MSGKFLEDKLPYNIVRNSKGPRFQGNQANFTSFSRRRNQIEKALFSCLISRKNTQNCVEFMHKIYGQIRAKCQPKLAVRFRPKFAESFTVARKTFNDQNW